MVHRWSKWICVYGIRVLVVEHDIRKPDVVGGDSQFLDAVIDVRVPDESVVIPLLQDIKIKDSRRDNSWTSLMFLMSSNKHKESEGEKKNFLCCDYTEQGFNTH